MRGKLRWWIIGLVTLGTVLNYLARSTLSVAAPTLKAEFSMSTEDYSWVVLAFQLAYTVMQTVAGTVLDALGTRLGFAVFAVGWALANMAHALATGTWSLAAFRGLLGATEAAAIPAGPPPIIRMSVVRLVISHNLHSTGNEHVAAAAEFNSVDRDPTFKTDAHTA